MDDRSGQLELVKQETVFVHDATQYTARKNSADHRAIHGQARIQTRRRQECQIPVLREVSHPIMDARRPFRKRTRIPP